MAINFNEMRLRPWEDRTYHGFEYKREIIQSCNGVCRDLICLITCLNKNFLYSSPSAAALFKYAKVNFNLGTCNPDALLRKRITGRQRQGRHRLEFSSSFISLQMAGRVYRLLRRPPQFGQTYGSSHELNMENMNHLTSGLKFSDHANF